MDDLETRRQEEEAAQRQFEQTEQREEVGLITITEVYESQAAYDLARNNTILAEDNLATAYEALEAITGQPHPNIDVLSEDFPAVSVDGTMDSWTQQALDSNLSLIAARYNLEAEQENLKARKSEHLPTISASGTFNHNVTAGGQAADGGLRSTGAIDGSALSLTINIPLYSGGGTSARRTAAEYDVIAQQEALNLTRRQTTQDVRNAFRRVNTDALVITQRQQAITSARSALEAIEVGYEVGTRNIVDVLQARQQLFVALRNYSDARYNYVVDTLLLKQVTGLLTPQDIIELNEWLETESATAAP
jgi:outer membrane protein